jgi:hypothetical protein
MRNCNRCRRSPKAKPARQIDYLACNLIWAADIQEIHLADGSTWRTLHWIDLHSRYVLGQLTVQELSEALVVESFLAVARQHGLASILKTAHDGLWFNASTGRAQIVGLTRYRIRMPARGPRKTRTVPDLGAAHAPVLGAGAGVCCSSLWRRALKISRLNAPPVSLRKLWPLNTLVSARGGSAMPTMAVRTRSCTGSISLPFGQNLCRSRVFLAYCGFDSVGWSGAAGAGCVVAPGWTGVGAANSFSAYEPG